jgi:serine/threonine protein kinase
MVNRVTRRATLRTTPVDLHFVAMDAAGTAAAHVELHEEVRVLLACRHPDILFMVGFSLDLGGGPALVMERALGSAAQALLIAPFTTQDAFAIAAQVVGAVHYLHDNSVHHRAIHVENVMLLTPPRTGHMIAKLGGFGAAKRNVSDQKVLMSDIRALTVCIFNLFARASSEVLKFDYSIEEQSISATAFQALTQIFPEKPEIAKLLVASWTAEDISAADIATGFAMLQEREPSASSRTPSSEDRSQSAARAAPQLLGRLPIRA